MSEPTLVYGEPRLTRDIDLVVALHPRDAARFASAWATEDFYVPPVEVIADESGRPTAGHFKVIHQHTTMRADVYLTGNDPLDAWAFARTVIQSKLRYFQIGGSERHLRDIALMLRVSGALVDRAELERWAIRLGVVGEWQQAQELN